MTPINNFQFSEGYDNRPASIIEKDWNDGDYRCVVKFQPLGHRCGYVGIPDEIADKFPNIQERDLESEIDCHGGVTYAEHYLRGVDNSDKYFWIGFDCMHVDDAPDIDAFEKYYPNLSLDSTWVYPGNKVRSLSYCEAECKKIVNQLENPDCERHTDWLTKGISEEQLRIEKIFSIISAKIYTKRTQMGMSQKAFAQFMGVSQGMVSRWESGTYNFSISTLVRLYSKLGLDFGIQIFNREPASQNTESEKITEKMESKETKVEKNIRITFGLEILGASLLTVAESVHLPKRLKKYANWWWLKSPGHNSHCTAFFHSGGFIDHYGSHVDCIGSVRPVLIISNLESTDLQVGDTFEFGGTEFEIISTDRAFCLGDIDESCFREDWTASDANNYEKSDIKKYVDNWFEESKGNRR